MKISTKGRYALRMILDLASHKDAGFITLKEVADRQNISKKYLEQIVPILKQSQYLKTSKGFQGGYMLAKDPSQITVGSILRTTEGSLAPVACLEGGTVDCVRAELCPTLYVWEGLYEVIEKYLDGISVQDILDKKSIAEYSGGENNV